MPGCSQMLTVRAGLGLPLDVDLFRNQTQGGQQKKQRERELKREGLESCGGVPGAGGPPRRRRPRPQRGPPRSARLRRRPPPPLPCRPPATRAPGAARRPRPPLSSPPRAPWNATPSQQTPATCADREELRGPCRGMQGSKQAGKWTGTVSLLHVRCVQEPAAQTFVS